MFLSWLTPRLAAVLRPLGVHGVGLLGDVDAQFVDANPGWQRVQSELVDLKRQCDAQRIRMVVMILPTDGHPNARGHQIMAEALTKFLQPIVADVARAGVVSDHPSAAPARR